MPVRFSASSTSLGSKKTPPSKRRPHPVRIFSGPLVRILLLAALAVVACIWALARHYGKSGEAAAPAAVDAGEIPVEILED